jgi:hypothetical protein
MYVNNIIFGTSPLIIHAPGLQHSRRKKIVHRSMNPYWIPIIRSWEKELPVLCRKETKDALTIITWNSTGVKGSCERSLEKLGVDYLCLGKNIKKWRFIDKITTALDIIDSISTPYVMALDSFDVVVLRDPYEAVEKFKKMNCNMLFNGEKNYHPDLGITTTGNYSVTDTWKKYEKSIAKSEWKFLNAGALIAKTEFYKEFLRESLNRHESIKNNPEALHLPRDPVYKKYPDYKVGDDDQLIDHWIYQDFYPSIMIDYTMEIFFNTVFVPLNKNKLVIPNNVFTGLGAFQYGVEVSLLGILLKIYFILSKIQILPVIIKNIFKK